jgi:acetyl/propionyl-CoA carboxylase alpha subunit
VTELVTGVDLVRAQIEIATERRLPVLPEGIARRGHAIEARVYAEDAARGFLPQAGTATKVRWPRGAFVRVDAGIDSGDAVPVHYDPILAKVVAHGPTREEALARLSAALDDALVHGVTTNLPFLRALVRNSDVARGAFDTEWIERELMDSFEALVAAPAPELALIAASLHVALGGSAATGPGANGRATSDAVPATTDPFRAAGSWRLA